MKLLNDFVNNRELAIIIWGGIFLILAFSKKSLRTSIISFLKALSQRKILLVIIFMFIYISLIIYSFYTIQLLEITDLFDTIFWVFGVAFIMLVNINSANDEGYFKKVLLDSIKLILILEFIVNLYVFSFIIEMILVPILVLIGVLIGISTTDKKYKQIESISKIILTVIGVIILANVLIHIYSDFKEFSSIENLLNLILSPALTIAFIPFIYFTAAILIYESIFKRINAFTSKPELASYSKWKIFFAFHINLKALNQFSKKMGWLEINEKNDIINIINEVKREAN